jgi:hypothetical protein
VMMGAMAHGISRGRGRSGAQPARITLGNSSRGDDPGQYVDVRTDSAAGCTPATGVGWCGGPARAGPAMARMRSAPGGARASSGWWRTSTEHSYLKTAALFGTGRSEARPKADTREAEAEVQSGSNATLGIRSSSMRRPSGCSAPYPHSRGLRHGKHLESSAATADRMRPTLPAGCTTG